jgi:hypothetical protein
LPARWVEITLDITSGYDLIGHRLIRKHENLLYADKIFGQGAVSASGSVAA